MPSVIDYRSLYCATLRGWLGVAPAPVLATGPGAGPVASSRMTLGA